MRHASAPCKATHKQLPRDAWQLRVHDQDPAYMSWETSVKIRARRTDNDAEYDRHQRAASPARARRGCMGCAMAVSAGRR
jgi:hypothetical protein